MLTRRVIPCLDVIRNRVTKGVRFQNNVDLGDPVELAARYYEEGCDELVVYDITASHEERKLFTEVLRQTAERYGFVCLLHEKPFAGINGSGKHNNWSINYGSRNLLNPGSDPDQNAIFLTTLCAIIEAVDLHADLLRASVTGVGNDHRLGANEAPPAVISIYLGDQLADVIDQLEKGEHKSSKHGGTLRIGVDTLPPLPQEGPGRHGGLPYLPAGGGGPGGAALRIHRELLNGFPQEGALLTMKTLILNGSPRPAGDTVSLLRLLRVDRAALVY